MKLGIAALLEKIEQGEDLESISLSLISVAEKELLKCCAVVRTFNEALVDDYFRPLVPDADKESVAFSQLIKHSFVQRVPRTDGEFYLQPEAQKQYYDAWWHAPVGGETKVTKVPKLLRQLSKRLLNYYERLGRAGELDLLAQQVFVNKTKALKLFETLYRASDEAFDLAHCRDIINVLTGRENILGASFSKTLNDKDRYLQSRSLWATEYYQTVSYYERKKLSEGLESFLAKSAGHDPAEKWILNLHAPGGMGKTMFVRWLTSRRCVPEPYRIPCGRVDFDFVDRITATQHRWLLFLELARELDAQIPGNFFNSLIGKFSDYERILNHAQVQQGTSSPSVQLPPREKLESEMLYLFSKSLKDANLAKPIVLIFDTLEEVILYHPDDILELVRQLEIVHQAVPDLVLVLSGRYDLTESDPAGSSRIPQFGTDFGRATQTILVELFEKEEALGFLIEKKGLSKDYPLEMVVKRSEGNPFKLALFADILLDDPDITAETIRDYPSADLLYLIERVLSRIPNKSLHWLLRYGVVPRTLTRSFVKEVLKKHLQVAMSGDASQDDPRRYKSLVQKARETVEQKEILPRNNINSPERDLDVDELWIALQNYASNYAWVTMESGDPNTVKFHGDVVDPMRRWLEQEPVYKVLHQQAISYFENKAQTEPGDWEQSMRSAVYHKFQLEGANAADYWRQLIAGEESPERRRELAREIIGLEYVDDDLEPLRLLNGQQITEISTLVEAYYQIARASVEIARAENASKSSQLWSEADYDLWKCEQLQKRVPEAAVSPANIAAVQAAILTSQGKGDEAIKTVEEALSGQPNDRERLRLEGERAAAFAAQGSYHEAGLHLRVVLDLAERVERNPKLVLETRKRLARLYREAGELEVSASEFVRALDFVTPDDLKTKIELSMELADVYFEMGQYGRGVLAIDQMRSLEDGPSATLIKLRYLNYMTRFFLASGKPLTALELSRSAGAEMFPAHQGDSKYAFDVLVITSQEQWGMAQGQLFEFEEARDALEFTRTQWREIGDSKAASRCMLKKAELCLATIGDVFRTRSVLDEVSRLTIETDPEQWLEQELLRLKQWHLCGEEKRCEQTLGRLKEWADKGNLKPALCAKLMLGSGVWKLLPNDEETSNKFFSDLTAVLEQIEPPSARMLLLDPLSDYPACQELYPHVIDDFISLFPLGRKDGDFLINAPKVAEALRVVGSKDQALALLKELSDNVSKDDVFALRKTQLIRARTTQSESLSDELSSFVREFLAKCEAYPLLCASTLVELAELTFSARPTTDANELLNTAEQFLNLKGSDSQWMARLLALRGKLSIAHDSEKARTELRSAINLYESLGNKLAVANLRDLIATEGRDVAAPDAESTTNYDLEKAKPERDLAWPLRTTPNIITLHVQDNWTEAVTINTTIPGEVVATRKVSIEPETLLDQLLAFDTYENYSFSFLRQMDDDWIKVCSGLGQILMDEKQAQKFQPSGGKKNQQTALCLIIDALQLSAPPWELMAFPSYLDGPASISPAVSYLYRSLGPNTSTNLSDVIWLQSALSELGKNRIFPDGVYGKQTQDALSRFQREQGLPDHGLFDGRTRRMIKSVLRSQSTKKRLRVLLLRAGIERQRAVSRGIEVWGFNPEKRYEEEDFADVFVVDNPETRKLEKVMRDFDPQVVHIFPTMQESPSIGIYLEFGSHGSSLPTKGAARSFKKSSSSTGDVEFFTLSALAELMKKMQKPDLPRPLLILDVLEPPGKTELFTQLFLRNAFVAQLYQLGCFESIIATGLTPAEMQEKMIRTLIAALKSGDAVGDMVNQLRRVENLGTYARSPDFRGKPGAQRSPEDKRYLSMVAATAATALFTQDPAM